MFFDYANISQNFKEDFGMKHFLILALISLMMTSTACAQTADPSKTARALIKNSAGEEIGSAEFEPVADGVLVRVSVSKLSPGKHGIHIHEFGKCEGPDFKSAGAHFNPSGKKHGLNNPEGSHAGDMPNLEISADGTAKQEFILKGVSIDEGSNALLKADGSSIMIHAGPDDEMTDPSGNSGDRIACGVITR